MNNPYLNNTTQNDQNNQNGSILSQITPNFNSAGFLQGAIIGAIGAYILTNENAQQAIFKAVVKMGKLIQAGSEELKERFEDAKAEIQSQQ